MARIRLSRGRGGGLRRGRQRRTSPAMNDVTRILSAIEQGDPKAAERAPAAGLRRAPPARRPAAGPGEARADAPGHGPGARGLPPAGRRGRARRWDGRGHFFAAAAEAMRRILVDNARRKRAEPRRRPRFGWSWPRGTGSPPPPTSSSPSTTRSPGWPRTTRRPPSSSSSGSSPGCPSRRPPGASGLSRATAYRHWTYARAWLLAERRG